MQGMQRSGATSTQAMRAAQSSAILARACFVENAVKAFGLRFGTPTDWPCAQAGVKAVNIAAGGELRRQGIIDLRPMEKLLNGAWHDMLVTRPRLIIAAFCCIWVISVTMLTQVRIPHLPRCAHALLEYRLVMIACSFINHTLNMTMRSAHFLVGQLMLDVTNFKPTSALLPASMWAAPMCRVSPQSLTNTCLQPAASLIQQPHICCNPPT